MAQCGVVGGAGGGGEAEPGAHVAIRPPLVAARLMACWRIWGCQRLRTSPARACARAGRGRLIWSLTYRSTVRWEMPSRSATCAVLPLCCLTR